MTVLILEAIIARAKANELTALANLNNYLSNPAGIGEHPDIVAEVDKLVKDVAEAREQIKTVNDLINESNNQNK
jgi:hypothetical protein